MAYKQLTNPNKFHRRIGHKIAAAKAAGKSAKHVLLAMGYANKYAEDRASWYLHQNFVKERIEQLKERYAADIYDASVKAGLKALADATPRELPKVIEVLAKITPRMMEPERKETHTTATKIPLFPADLTIEEPPQLTEGELQESPINDDLKKNVSTDGNDKDHSV